MNSFKGFSKIIYLFNYGLFVMISVVSSLLVFLLSVWIIKSSTVLFVSGMIIFHKILLIMILVELCVFLLIRLYTFFFENIIETSRLMHVCKIVKRNIVFALIGFVSIILYYHLGGLIGYQVVYNVAEMNVLGVIVFLLIIDGSELLVYGNRKFMMVFMGVLLSFLLFIKYIEIKEGMFPVEFSSLSYMVVPVVFLLRIRKLYIVAAYAGMMAGFFYYIYIIVAGGTTYQVLPSLEVLRSMYGHGVLLLTSLVALKKISFKKGDAYLILLFVIGAVSWAIYFRPEFVVFRYFIYELIDGDYLYFFTDVISRSMLFGYYLFMLVFVLSSVRVFLGLNHLFIKKEAELSASFKYEMFFVGTL